MNTLDVTQIPEMPADKVSELIKTIDRHRLSFVLWKKPAQEPVVSFSLLHSKQCIYLQYYVRESERRATVQKTNGPVWEDSCVEFFISLDNRMSYFNFEFNSFGIKLAAFGTTRTKRRMLPVLVVDTIKTQVDLIKMTPGNFEWNLFVAIPLTVFQQPAGFALAGKKCSGNFYKCGDELKDPHYLSWSEIKSSKPDFHLPEYFDDIFFRS